MGMRVAVASAAGAFAAAAAVAAWLLHKLEVDLNGVRIP
jgi:hypothetical protein